FGQNMTSLTYSLSRAMGRMMKSGEEIIITALDHEANRGPWLALEESGIVIREVRMQPNGILDYRDLKEKVNPHTRLIALGYCSNALGTVNNVQMARELADKVGAWLLLDAVHYAAHFPIDVQTIGCDFLLCSAYKFYGPHVGMLYSKPGLLDLLPVDRLRTQEQAAPYLIETGTLNHAALAGVSATIDYIASFGSGNNYREKIVDAMETISGYEHRLGEQLYRGLSSMHGVKIQGVDFMDSQRAPTISFLVEGMTASQLCEKLSERSICAWDGHFYAIRAMEMLGLQEKGGVTRLGVLVYNTLEEIDYTISAINEIIP
ncbi:MAG: aminotransferase class V-fold PLP-dependent enzyme, partial [Bacteroidetes bacterium]|nr:aminotransferase class V-fold PLP-dependent enzyme [Bacteroidota bacterium]